ncbi:MAG: hypothetical protein JNJ59_00455 [Deltaproteobacteria bacterium]|nr:hypothetical protein [Deltaproteobacteria bacterium]
MRAHLRRVLDAVAFSVIVGPHAFGCATTETGTWEVTRKVDVLVPASELRSTCGGREACVALCENIRTNQLDEPYRNICQTDRADSYEIVGCEPRGRDLVITCEWEDSHKGCMPDS